MSRCLVLLALLLPWCWACRAPAPEAPRVLIDLDFADETSPRGTPEVLLSADEPFWLEGGWGRPQRRGIWMLGDRAAIAFLGEPGASVLQLRCATRPRLRDRGQRLTLSVNDVELGAFDVASWEDPLAIRLELPAAALRPGLNRLQLTARVHDDPLTEGRAHAVHLQALRLTLSLPTDRSLSPPASPGPLEPTPVVELAPPERGDRPDVLLVLLDAARPDHFGCYGYGRDTTPFVDRLAAEGIIFTQAFTPAPFTRTAMPSLLTGRSWLEHGVLEAGDVLPDSLPTLAGILRAAGYRTLGISANPNVGLENGCARGFERFVECWKEHDGLGPARQFERPERWLLRLLAEDAGEDPLFALVHVIPPHQPYAPGAEHDLWRDPEYGGSITRGSHALLEELDAGRFVPSAADRERLISLYDGNLHRADQMTRRMVEGWRRERAGRPLLVVVLADHGEAFGEHGRYRHGATVHDEMTRVPLVFFPRGLCAPLVEGRERLRSLEDVLPLLLHALDLPLPASIPWPRQTVRLHGDPSALRPAVILRGHHAYGWREPSRLAILDPWRGPSLYDLRKDPLQRDDLLEGEIPHWPEALDGLWATLRWGARRRTQAGVALDEEDLEALRALGYVED